MPNTLNLIGASLLEEYHSGEWKLSPQEVLIDPKPPIETLKALAENINHTDEHLASITSMVNELAGSLSARGSAQIYLPHFGFTAVPMKDIDRARARLIADIAATIIPHVQYAQLLLFRKPLVYLPLTTVKF